jgi:hypothetical protein
MVMRWMGLTYVQEKFCPCLGNQPIKKNFVPFLRTMVLYATIVKPMQSGTIGGDAEKSMDMGR